MALFCNCAGELKQVKADFQIKARELETEVARLETLLASMRGLINAKLGGKEFKKRKKSYIDDEDDENDDPFSDLTPEEREFIQGMSIQERERLINERNSRI